MHRAHDTSLAQAGIELYWCWGILHMACSGTIAAFMPDDNVIGSCYNYVFLIKIMSRTYLINHNEQKIDK